MTSLEPETPVDAAPSAAGVCTCGPEGQTVNPDRPEAPAPATIAGRLKLRVLRDHAAIEVFGAEGLMSASREIALPAADGSVALRVDGHARLVAMTLHELRSAWPGSQ